MSLLGFLYRYIQAAMHLLIRPTFVRMYRISVDPTGFHLFLQAEYGTITLMKVNVDDHQLSHLALIVTQKRTGSKSDIIDCTKTLPSVRLGMMIASPQIGAKAAFQASKRCFDSAACLQQKIADYVMKWKPSAWKMAILIESFIQFENLGPGERRRE